VREKPAGRPSELTGKKRGPAPTAEQHGGPTKGKGRPAQADVALVPARGIRKVFLFKDDAV